MTHRIKRDVNISSGSAKSGEADDLRDYRIGQIQMPGSWDTADLAFETASGPNASYQPLYDDAGNRIVATADSSRNVLLSGQALEELESAWGVKVVSWDTANATTTNQSADRTLTLMLVGD